MGKENFLKILTHDFESVIYNCLFDIKNLFNNYNTNLSFYSFSKYFHGLEKSYKLYSNINKQLEIISDQELEDIYKIYLNNLYLSINYLMDNILEINFDKYQNGKEIYDEILCNY